MIARRLRPLLLFLLLLLLPPCSAEAQTDCRVTDIKRAFGFDTSTGIVTLKDKKGMFAQRTFDGAAMKVFDKNGSFRMATFRYKATDAQQVAGSKTAEELKAMLLEHLATSAQAQADSFAPLSRLEVSTLKAVDFDIVSGQVTFHDKGGNCFVASTTAGMTLDFLGSGSQTGAKLFLDGLIAWAIAKGKGIPLTDAAGKNLRDVGLPNAIKEEAQLIYE